MANTIALFHALLCDSICPSSIRTPKIQLHLLSIITFVTQSLLLIYVVIFFVFNLLQYSFCVQMTNNIEVDVATSFLVFFITMLEAIYFIYNLKKLVRSKFGVWFLGCYQHGTSFVLFINVTLLTT
jgi:hypothetical protein